MEKRLAVLLVGIGGYGETYIKEAIESPNEEYEVAAVADPFASISPYYQEIVNREIPVFSSPEEFFLSGRRADLTVISSPIHTHYSYILTALENGSNVLCEKPVTISEERMKTLIEAEEKSGLFVAVGYQLCFSRDVQSLKRRIAAGEFGRAKRMKALRMMRRGDKYYARTSWAGKLISHGEYVFDSPVSNACAHQVQVMLYLLGKERELSAGVESVDGVLWKARPGIENYDSAALRINTDMGTELMFYTSHSLDEKKVGPIMEMEFEKAVIKGEDDNFVIYHNDGRVEDLTSFDKGPRLEKLYSSLSSIKNGVRPPVTLKSSLSHIRVVLEAERLPLFLRYDALYKTAEDGDSYWSVEGIREEYLRLYEDWALPGEKR